MTRSNTESVCLPRQTPAPNTVFKAVELSLEDLLGEGYVDAVCRARAYLWGEDEAGVRTLAAEKIDLYPKAFQQRLLGLLPQVGRTCCPPLDGSARGATSRAFEGSSKTAPAPLSAMGFYRLGEDGRLYLTAKSEHYHVPLGHAFPGFELVERAQRLGIPNATHNNTRGHITRLLEQELVRAAAGIARGDAAALDRLLASDRASDMNRVLNLETGSLAAEAALKLALSRFHRAQAGSPEPKYQGRVPVLVVIGDDDGGIEANYHGTTVLAQAMRGMWPDLAAALARQEALLVRAVKPNDVEGLEAVFGEYDVGRYKIAACFHELVLMNYAAKRLDKEYVRRMYALCAQHDVPPVVDEIQTGIWSPELFMFREYGVQPAMVAIGKGFPDGQYPASRLLFSGAFDTLPQFGALVTNGQEELASLTYLITMRWAAANADVTRAVGDYYQGRLNDLARAHPKLISAIEGSRHMAGIYFRDIAPAKAFAKSLNDGGIDVSVQTYKVGCPPSPLTKLPLTAGFEVVDMVIERMHEALRRI